MRHDYLNAKFLEAINEIGEHGETLYGPLPKRREDHRNPARVTPKMMGRHAITHFLDYLRDEKHDHFRTRKHQLAAVAYNAMMEFQFADLEDEL